MSTQTARAWSVGDILKTTASYLEEKGVAGARLDAELMLSRVLKRQRIFLYADPGKILAEGELSAYRELVRRRASREPLSYILGEKEFYSLAFKVGPGVLVPRPETEVLWRRR